MSGLDRSAVVDACGYFDSWLASQRELLRVPGVQAAVLLGDEILLDTAHGVSWIDTGEPLTTDHLFRIASHSKTFTATAIMQLVEAGAVRLDDPVEMWVPELADTAIASITLREMLSHSSGVIRDGRDGDFWQLDRGFPDRADLLRVARDDAAVIGRNERFKYSNITYSLLGLVIEAASGEPYADHVTRHVVDPLGLADTGPEYEPGRAHDYAGGHTALAYGERIPIEHVDTRAMAAATGFYSTARDLVRYAAAHFDGDDRLVGPDARREMQHDGWKVDQTEGAYGLGFEAVTIGGRRVLGHGGGYPGHITRTYFDPVDRLAVCVFTNAIDGPALGWAQTLLRLVELASNGRDAARDDGSDGSELARYTGRFATLWGAFDVVALGGRLVQLSPTLPDPTVAVTELSVVDDDMLRIGSTSGYGSRGELVHYRRSAAGGIDTLRTAAMTAWPIDRFRAAVSARARISEGSPARP